MVTIPCKPTIQQVGYYEQYIPLHWGPWDHGSPDLHPNLYLQALVAAARRGVQVQVMIGGRGLDPTEPTDSTHTRDYLEFLARRGRLDLAVRIAGPELGLTIHNKGLLVDHRYSLISSINWSENSPVHNRELALLVDSPGVAAYFAGVFSADWRALGH